MRHQDNNRACTHLVAGVILSAAALVFAVVVQVQAATPPRTSPQAARARDQGPTTRTRDQLDRILKEVSTYDGGIESAALWKLRDYVQARKDDPAARAECERKLLAFLKTPATPSARIAVARQLRIVAGDQGVAALLALVADERTADNAIYALQRIPGAAADQALIQALSLPKLIAATRIAVIGALGERRSTEAVPALVPLVKQAEFARAAVFSLGRIGGDAADQALVAVYGTAPADLKAAVAGAMMQSAEQWLASRNERAALQLYDKVFADGSLPVAVREAAAIGRIAADGPAAEQTLLTYLTGPDVELQEAAISKVPDVIKPAGIGQVASLLPRRPEASQVKLLAVLAGYPGAAVRPAILEAARSSSAPVRIAAIKALESAGDASVVPFLCETAAKARGAEQTAARSALGGLKGRAVDEAIVALMATQPPDEIQGELLLAMANRRIFAAKPVIASSLRSSSPRIRLQALRALRTIGTPSDVPAVLDVLASADDDAERAEAEQTTALLAQKIANPDGRSGAVKSRFNAENDPQVRVRLLGVLARIGDNSALPIVRGALAESDAEVYDAAVRALAAWPTSAARDDVMVLARDSRNEVHRLLAVRGLVRIIGLDRYRLPEAGVADLKQAAGFSWRPDEQKLVLAALVQFACTDALEFAAGFLREPSVKAEAQAAIEKIKERLGRAGT
jgi:HEAT repeat protein